jgi:hypothetical protein
MARIETGRKTVTMKTSREMILNNSVALFFFSCVLCVLRVSAVYLISSVLVTALLRFLSVVNIMQPRIQ